LGHLNVENNSSTVQEAIQANPSQHLLNHNENYSNYFSNSRCDYGNYTYEFYVTRSHNSFSDAKNN
jgi:hypothetical protein